jgi:hypothetical protein
MDVAEATIMLADLANENRFGVFETKIRVNSITDDLALRGERHEVRKTLVGMSQAVTKCVKCKQSQ